MAAFVNTTGNSSRLKDVFERGFKVHQEIENTSEPSNSETVQQNIRTGIECFTQCTEMVNELQLFSCNEDIDEVPTTDLRFLLLPALLGDLTLLKMSDERMEDIRTTKIYCIDYLKRCQNYGVTEEDISVHIEECEGSENVKQGLQQMESSREAKIRRYKQTKQREQRLKELSDILCDSGQSVDEEVQREHTLLLIKLWIDKCIEHLSSIKSELEILEHMEKMTKQNGSKGVEPAKPPTRSRPMKPVLITRELIESKVFGAGYPSVPTISQEEFFQKEVREGKIVLEYKSNSKSRTDNKGVEEDDEQNPDEDDETAEKLAKARAWDDWKDDHRRGWGNTDNRG